jgi:hypothetical protein
MAYIIKNTSGLLNTRITDTGRLRLSQGRFDIRYFQIGDSEVSYNSAPNYNQTNNFILEAAYNSQNSSQEPNSNKMNLKYPFYVKGSSGSTYGIAIQESVVSPIYNTAATRGFFTGTPYSWSAITNSAYTKNANYTVDLCLCNGNLIVLEPDFCSPTTGTPEIGDIITFLFDGNGGCGNITGNFPILTYKIQNINGNLVELDRNIPNFSGASCCGNARALIYPSGMTELYDTTTPMGYWPPDVINFESICDLGNTDVKVWNMNIPWSVNPAGLWSALNESYNKFGSVEYLGSKEYFGYQEVSGQTFWVSPTMTAETTDTFYYNSFDDVINVQPNEQKAIAIVHYTNNAVDSFYGEKFALEPYDINAIDQTGFARNFKVTIPSLMWHKSSTGNMGEIFYVDPPGFDNPNLDLFQVKYMKSSKNLDMNNPGLRYYHLYDTHPNSNGYPSRVGKVFPDLKQIIFDDEEIVAALSYKSNRNWTLSAPRLSLSAPNLCDAIDDDYGVMGNENEYMYVTYRFNSTAFTDSLHCNYYSKIQGPFTGCTADRQNVNIRFGNEFPFLEDCCFMGYNATQFQVLAQLVSGSTTQPDPGQWRVIDFTSQLSASSVNGFITPSGMTGNTFVISHNQYTGSPLYNLANYIYLPQPTGEEDILNFGDEYYFYGNIETDIQATIYEMKFLCNLASTQFTNTSNPTWFSGSTAYVTEIGLFNEDKELMVITKLQSPILRQGTQQYAIKIDF